MNPPSYVSQSVSIRQHSSGFSSNQSLGCVAHTSGAPRYRRKLIQRRWDTAWCWWSSRGDGSGLSFDVQEEGPFGGEMVDQRRRWSSDLGNWAPLSPRMDSKGCCLRSDSQLGKFPTLGAGGHQILEENMMYPLAYLSLFGKLFTISSDLKELLSFLNYPSCPGEGLTGEEHLTRCYSLGSR